MASAGAKPGLLIIMVKEPRLGRVKTRLGREIGAVAATAFYRRTSATLIARLGRDPRWETVLAVTPDRWRPRGGLSRLPILPQGKGDIGDRMGRLLARDASRPAVLIGSDIPGAAALHIAEAFRLLRRHDAVFGPAEDGGFWLVGVRAGFRAPQMFGRVRWSSPHALADTLANMGDYRTALAARLGDVDDASDFARHAHMGTRLTLPSSPAAR